MYTNAYEQCSHEDYCIRNSFPSIVVASSWSGSEPKYTSNPLATIQVICLLPQDVCSKFPKGRFNSRLTFGIP